MDGTTFLCERCENCLGFRIPRTIDTCGTIRKPKTYVDCGVSRKSVWTMTAREYDESMLPYQICGSYKVRRSI